MTCYISLLLFFGINYHYIMIIIIIIPTKMTIVGKVNWRCFRRD